MYYRKFKTDICEMIIVGDEKGITRLELMTNEGKRIVGIQEDWIEQKEYFTDEINQIKEYIEGKRKNFDIKLNLIGTDFQKKVWHALTTIAYGETKSYKDIACIIGNEKASRAVGMANGKNPIPLIIPCHRVIGADGSLTGYAFGIDIKTKILSIEARNK